MPLIIRFSKITTSIMSDPDIKPGPSDGCCFVRITDIPKGVSIGQVILLFEHTAKKAVERGKYEFRFSELCPIGGVDLNWGAGPQYEPI